MLQRLAHVCYRYRRRVVVLWLAALVGVNVIGSQVGSNYSQSFSLPGTESQRAIDLLQARFPAKAGDSGQIVFSTAAGVRDLTVGGPTSGDVLAALAWIIGIVAVCAPIAVRQYRRVV